MPVINFANPTRDSATVSAYTKKVLTEILKKAGINQVSITSAGRTASDQARILYDNISRHGVPHQKGFTAPMAIRSSMSTARSRQQEKHPTRSDRAWRARLPRSDPAKFPNMPPTPANSML